MNAESRINIPINQGDTLAPEVFNETKATASSVMTRRDQKTHAGPNSSILLALILGFAALLRFLFLTSKSFWSDEGFSAFMARTDFQSFMHFIRHGEMHIFFYYALLRLWTYVASGEWFIRSFSAFASVATVAVVYLIGNRLFDAKVGLVAALLLAVHPAHIAYAQEARPYAFETLLVSLSALFLLRFFQTGSRPDYVAYICSAVLAVYSHFLAVFIPLGHWPVLLIRFWNSSIWRVLVVTLFTSVLLLLPILIYIFRSGGSSPDWLSRPTPHDVVGFFWFLTMARYGLLYAIGWLTALWALLRQWQSPAPRWTLLFVVCWLVLPSLFILLLSLAKPLFLSRYLLVCVPAAVLLAAFGFNSLARSVSLVCISLTLIASLVMVRSYYRHPQGKEDWRSANRYVSTEARAGDAVIVLPEYGRFTFTFYSNLRALPSKELPYALLNGDIEGSSRSATRLWLVVFGYQNSDHAIGSVQSASNSAYCGTHLEKFYLIEVSLLEACQNGRKPAR